MVFMELPLTPSESLIRRGVSVPVGGAGMSLRNEAQRGEAIMVGRPDLLLALDVGTQSARALLFDLDGELVGKGQAPLDAYRSPQPGWHEIDAEVFWSQLAAACQQLWASHRQMRGAVRGVALTTQRATVVPVDAAGRPLAPVITWLDQRRAAAAPRLLLKWRIAQTLGAAEGVMRRFAREAESNWFAESRPDVAAKTHKFLLLSGYLHLRLTGRFVDSVGSQVGYIPFDYKRQQWAKPDDWKWRALTLRPDQMPELAPVSARLGAVLPAASADTGIPAGLPVIAAAADKACGVLGSGCNGSTIGGLSYGTTATIAVRSPRYVEAIRLAPAYPSATPGYYESEVQIFRGYWMVSWFRDQFAEREKAEAARLGVSPESLLDALAASAPPGAMGLTLQPYWTPGIRFPPADAKGAIIGFGDVHTRAHLYRAILEGLAYAMRDGASRIERKTGQRLTQLRASGGGSQSDAALQITADVFNLPVGRPHTYETAGLGAAIVCAVGLKLHPDFDTAMAAMTRLAKTFAPNPDHAARYDALYAQVFKRMYPRLAPLYTAIQKITGYPEMV